MTKARNVLLVLVSSHFPSCNPRRLLKASKHTSSASWYRGHFQFVQHKTSPYLARPQKQLGDAKLWRQDSRKYVISNTTSFQMLWHRTWLRLIVLGFLYLLNWFWFWFLSPCSTTNVSLHISETLVNIQHGKQDPLVETEVASAKGRREEKHK